MHFSKTCYNLNKINMEGFNMQKTNLHVILPAPTVNTFSKSPAIAICLYSCGDWAK